MFRTCPGEVREQIIYNHLKRGNQPKEFRRKVKPFLPKLALTRSLLPELARRLGNRLFTERMAITERGLLDFVEKPNEFLIDVLRPLDSASRAGLALIFMSGGRLASPLSLSPEEEKALELFGSNLAGVREALTAMRESLVLQVNEGESWFWRFKHPTVRDAFGKIIAEDRELLDVYLAGAPLNKLCAEMTCGDVGIKGVKVIVPTDRFERIIKRLDTLDLQKGSDQHILLSFLAHRSGDVFLRRYLDLHPHFISTLQVKSFMDDDLGVAILAALNRYDLLPDHDRNRVAESIMHLAIKTPDACVLNDEEVGALLTEEERTKLMVRICTELIPNLDRVIQAWEEKYESADEGPEDFFCQLESQLSTFRKALGTNPEIVSRIDQASLKIRMRVQEHNDAIDWSYSEKGGITPANEMTDSRSIFDDVDY